MNKYLNLNSFNLRLLNVLAVYSSIIFSYTTLKPKMLEIEESRIFFVCVLSVNVLLRITPLSIKYTFAKNNNNNKKHKYFVRNVLTNQNLIWR